MILLVDSGATNSTWKFMDSSGEVYVEVKNGINVSTSDLNDINLQSKTDVYKVSKIFFFGAGTGHASRDALLEIELRKSFPSVSEVIIGSDLLSAGFALSHSMQSVLSILGTGSNSCLYSGGNIDLKTKNLGYLLGDEGSGYAMGREVLRKYFYKEMSSEDASLFNDEYQLSRDELIKKIYHSATKPNTYISGFCAFLSQSSPELRNAISSKCLGEFFEHHLKKYENCESLPHHFSGSIAWHFQEEIAEMCGKYGFKLGNIIQNPIDSLSYDLLAKI